MKYEQDIQVLKETIQWFKKQIEPHDCGWMYTTIDGLKHRIKHLRSKIKKEVPPKSWVKGYQEWKKRQCPHN